MEGRFRTAWAKGSSTRELAEALGSGVAVSLGKDWLNTCIAERVDLIVTGRMPSFEAVSIAMPIDVELDNLSSITAAIGGGPHSELAAHVTAALADAWLVPASLVTVCRNDAEKSEVQDRVRQLAADSGVDSVEILEAGSAGAILDTLDESSLLVVGAPGGSWLQRQFFGPGHRLAVKAPGGALVVRHAPPRAFHAVAQSSLVFGPQMNASEAKRLADAPVVPVAEDGRLVGIVRIAALADHPPEAEVQVAMEPPVSIDATEPAEAADDLRDFLDGGPVPVVASDGRLIGSIL
ncbi:MAG: hypothetical protein HKN91_03725 [Acidimicrobiia bacterium]|nr:hypothetical protein [Acidimicrobiia bacterium]